LTISAYGAEGEASQPPSSPGETTLFGTPQLHNVARPETLEYRFERTGPEALTDQVAVNISEIHPDGTKLVTFDFLTGKNRTFYPAVDHFSGNPLLMVFLEHDVNELKAQTGLAAAHFRAEIRSAFVDGARVSDTNVELDGAKLPAHEVVVKPFAHDDRLDKLPAYQNAEYRFVVADGVPGGIDSMSAAFPGDSASGAPPWSEKLAFTGVKP
jgi:hypothetical protein